MQGALSVCILWPTRKKAALDVDLQDEVGQLEYVSVVENIITITLGFEQQRRQR